MDGKKREREYYTAGRKRIGELNFDRNPIWTRERDGEERRKLWNAIFHRLTSGMPVIPLVVRHVDTHRVIPHRFHVVNSHVSILLLVAEHRIFTCHVNETWINHTWIVEERCNGHFCVFARRVPKKKGGSGGRRERGKISLASDTHVLNSCMKETIFIYIYMG